MKPIVVKLCLLGGMLLISGCYYFPLNGSMAPGGSARVDTRRYDLYDPFPDRAFGPDMQTRPRSFDVQRTEPRRAIEGRTFGQGPLEFGPAVPPSSPTSSQYPNVVQP